MEAEPTQQGLGRLWAIHRSPGLTYTNMPAKRMKPSGNLSSAQALLFGQGTSRAVSPDKTPDLDSFFHSFVHSFIHVCVRVHWCVCTQRPEVDAGSFSVTFHLIFWPSSNTGARSLWSNLRPVGVAGLAGELQAAPVQDWDYGCVSPCPASAWVPATTQSRLFALGVLSQPQPLLPEVASLRYSLQF